MTTYTYTKLKDESWGVRVFGATAAHQRGDVVTVAKKDGTKKEETVKAILWDGKDSKTGQRVILMAIGQRQVANSGRSRRDRDSNCDCFQCRRGSECQCIYEA